MGTWEQDSNQEHHRKFENFSLKFVLAASRTSLVYTQAAWEERNVSLLPHSLGMSLQAEFYVDDMKSFSCDAVSKSVPSRSFVDEEDITVGSLDLARLQKPL